MDHNLYQNILLHLKMAREFRAKNIIKGNYGKMEDYRYDCGRYSGIEECEKIVEVTWKKLYDGKYQDDVIQFSPDKDVQEDDLDVE